MQYDTCIRPQQSCRPTLVWAHEVYVVQDDFIAPCSRILSLPCISTVRGVQDHGANEGPVHSGDPAVLRVGEMYTPEISRKTRNLLLPVIAPIRGVQHGTLISDAPARIGIDEMQGLKILVCSCCLLDPGVSSVGRVQYRSGRTCYPTVVRIHEVNSV